MHCRLLTWGKSIGVEPRVVQVGFHLCSQRFRLWQQCLVPPFMLARVPLMLGMLVLEMEAMFLFFCGDTADCVLQC